MTTKKSVVKRKKKPTALIPLVLAAIVVFLFYQGTMKQTESVIQPVAVPIATVKLDEHTKIEEEHIAVVQIPARGVPPIVETDVQKIIGSYVGTKYTIPQNGYFLKEALSPLERIPSRIPMMLGENDLGITMRMNLEKSIANSLKEGQYVQVRFFTTQTPNKMPFEGVLEEKIKILALRDGTGTDVVSTDDEGTRVPTIVVFEANDEQVSYLLRAQNLGELNIVAISEEQYKPKVVVPEKEDGKSEGNSKAEESPDVNSNLVTRDELAQLIESLEDHLTKEQEDTLKKVQDVVVEEDGKGEAYVGNEVKLYIDAMTFRMKAMFGDSSFLVTPAGEIVYYDAETDQMRLFSSQEEYKGSVYALRDMTLEELEGLENSGSLTDAQKKVYQEIKLQASEPNFQTNAEGEYFTEGDDGKRKPHTNDEVIEQLQAAKERNAGLSQKNQKLLDSLIADMEDENISDSQDEITPAVEEEIPDEEKNNQDSEGLSQ